MSMPRELGRVLLTGSGGFLGLALTRRLRADGVTLVTSDLGGGDRPCDLTDAHATMALLSEGAFQTVFHCGAVSGPMVMADRPLDIWRINASGTAHVLEAARRHGAGRVVVCSSSEVYGRTAGPVDETTLPAPVSVYAASKVASEQAVFGYAREHGLDAVALRLSWIYGAGRTTPTVLESMLRASLGDGPVVLDGHADDLTHYLYVDDAVDGLLCAAKTSRLSHLVYNISAGEALRFGQIVDALRRLRPSAQITLGAAPSLAVMPSAIRAERSAADLGFEAKTPIGAGLAAYLEALAPSRAP